VIKIVDIIEVEYDDIMMLLFFTQAGIAKMDPKKQHTGWKFINKFVEKYLLEFTDD
jgi:hypothetical protein